MKKTMKLLTAVVIGIIWADMALADTIALPTVPPVKTQHETPTIQPEETASAPGFTETVPQADNIATYRGTFKVAVSSHFVNKDKSIVVDGYCAADKNLKTAWNTDGKGANEWIALSVKDENDYLIKGFRIANGYWKNDEVFWQNTRVKSLEVYCGETYAGTFQLQDSQQMQCFYFEKPVVGQTVKFVIRDVYPGKSNKDCVVTEIELLGNDSGQSNDFDMWGGCVSQLKEYLESDGVIKKGSRGMEVLGLQLILRDYYGMCEIEADGFYGSMSEQAVINLGEKLGVQNGGIVDLSFWRVMCG